MTPTKKCLSLLFILPMTVLACESTDDTAAPSQTSQTTSDFSDAGDNTEADVSTSADDTSEPTDDISEPPDDISEPPQDTATLPDNDTSEEDRVFAPGGNCDPYTQDCPDDDDGNSMQCVPVNGDPTCIRSNSTQLAAGGECNGGDCAAGSTCVNWGDRGQLCTQMCDRNTREGCDVDDSCSAWLRTNDNIGLCQPRPTTCDPYAQDCPDENDACSFGRDPDTNDPIFACVDAGDQAQGDSCSNGNGNCQAGLICIRVNDTESNCLQICQEGDTCPDDLTCSGQSTTWGVTFCR